MGSGAVGVSFRQLSEGFITVINGPDLEHVFLNGILRPFSEDLDVCPKKMDRDRSFSFNRVAVERFSFYQVQTKTKIHDFFAYPNLS